MPALLQELALELLIGKKVRIKAELNDRGSLITETFDGILRKLGDMFIVNDGPDSYVTFKEKHVTRVLDAEDVSIIEFVM